MRHFSNIAILSLSFSACAVHQPVKPTQLIVASRTAKISPASRQPLHSGIVNGSWNAGNCSLENNSLSYTSGDAKKTIPLDMPVRDAYEIICSDYYTVILTPKDLVVSLGGNPILEGSEMLGQLSGRFVPANCYSLNIEEPTSEQIVAASITGEQFTITTKAGNKWSVVLSDPSRWNIY
ncbi:hypothetical protein JXA56_01075 [Candidatus Micrarchaeota archaeon]|nr:hypothetical protein [Candidatus Micrarchaeota archaeon]